MIGNEPQPFSLADVKAVTFTYCLCTFSIGYFQSLCGRSCWESRNHRSFCRVIRHRPEEYVLWESSGDAAWTAHAHFHILGSMNCCKTLSGKYSGVSWHVSKCSRILNQQQCEKSKLFFWFGLWCQGLDSPLG